MIARNQRTNTSKHNIMYLSTRITMNDLCYKNLEKTYPRIVCNDRFLLFILTQ